MHKTLTALAALAVIAISAQADPPTRKSGCFFVNQSWTWKAADAQTMYVRVFPNRFFRLDLSGACPTLLRPDASLVTIHRSSTSICDALDWDMKVKDGPIGPAIPCIVKTMTELTPEEAAKIPQQFKPS